MEQSSSWSTIMEAFDNRESMDIDEGVYMQFQDLDLEANTSVYELEQGNDLVGVLALSTHGEAFCFRTVTHMLIHNCEKGWKEKLTRTMKAVQLSKLILVGKRLRDVMGNLIPAEIEIFYDPKDRLFYPCSCCGDDGCPCTIARLALRRFMKYFDYKMSHEYQSPPRSQNLTFYND